MTDNLNHPALTIGLTHLNVSLPTAVTAASFLQGLRGEPVDEATDRAIGMFLQEADSTALAELALAKLDRISFQSLAKLARQKLDPSHPNVAYLHEFAA
jgi:hypothetical protein